MSYQLRPYQQAAIDATWSYLCNATGNPVIVAPTGAGKSLLCAELARGCIENGLRTIILAHRKELLEQNAAKIRQLMPGASVGVYSAGLKSSDTEHDIIVAGIQSVYKRAFEFDARHLVIVDEAHLIPSKDDGMYRQFLADMKVSNPKHRVAGLTATPYRLNSGLIYGNGEMFDAVSYQIEIADLISQGFLSSVTNRPVVEVDTTSLHHRGGEFIAGEVENLFERTVASACQETVDICNADNRQHVLIFCSGVQHATHVSELIAEMTGEQVGLVTGETLELERACTLDAFRCGELRWLCNVDVLTTGFDAPCIDCIPLMRATESPALLAQMLGRGFRLSPGKTDFLVLDFGGNLRRLGQIDDPEFGRVKKKLTGTMLDDAPHKTCPACLETVHAGVKECGYCGFAFPKPDPKHDPTADTETAVLAAQRKPTRWKVVGVISGVHTKKGSDYNDPKTFRMTYEIKPFDSEEEGNLTTETISEWVCVEHLGFARRKAEKWWAERSEIPCPRTAEEAVEIQRGQGLADTMAITTMPDGKYKKIVAYELGERPDCFESYDSDVFEDVEIPF
jgi:DNA repair protein RadD